MALARPGLWSSTLLVAVPLTAVLWSAVLFSAVLLSAGTSRSAGATTLAQPQLERVLEQLAPQANPGVLRLAASALSCAAAGARRLAVIDYSLPSIEPRLWVFDLARRQLLFEELVSHGRGSGGARALRFSNVPESHQSSLGLFRTLGSYQGRNGYSLRLQGLEPGVNDRAFERAIVIHGADYVSESFIARTGRLGRSHGCPAVRSEVTRPLIDSIKDHQYLFIYYPDRNWLRDSEFLNCDRKLAAVGRR